MSNLDLPIKYSSPLITEGDKDAVLRAMSSGWLAGDGPIVREFEQALCDYTGYKYAIAVCNATAALDTVFLIERPSTAPNMTFVGTVNQHPISLVDSVNYHQVIDDPRLVDIGVSIAGYPCNNTRIVDDAHYLHRGMAHMKGPEHRVSVLSFHAIKPITCGEGGAILTNDVNIHLKAQAIINHGKNDLRRTPSRGYTNRRMASINAALGLSQLGRHDYMLRHRQAVALTYDTGLKAILFSTPPYHQHHARHLYQIKFNSNGTRDEFALRLKLKSILTQIHYEPINSNAEIFPNASNHWKTTLSLPMHNALTAAQVKYVVSVCNEITDQLIWEDYR